MRAFDHFLVTRMHVRIREGAALPDEGWLKPRLKLFESLLVPTVVGQKTADFRWLVCIDSESPEWLDDYVSRSTNGRAEAVRFDEACVGPAIASVIAARSQAEWLITSRVDTDDAIALDYMQRVQSSFRGTRELINFPAGIQVSRGVVFKYAHKSNAFISMAEPRTTQPFFTVFGDWHNRLAAHAPLRQVDVTMVMWLQSIHGKNVVNAVRGYPSNSVAVEERFGATVSQLVKRCSPAELLRLRILFLFASVGRAVRHPKRALDAGRSMARSLGPTRSPRST